MNNNIVNLEIKDQMEISGGDRGTGFLLAAFVDFEIGVAKGIWKAVKNFF